MFYNNLQKEAKLAKWLGEFRRETTFQSDAGLRNTIHASENVHRDMKHAGSLESTKDA